MKGNGRIVDTIRGLARRIPEIASSVESQEKGEKGVGKRTKTRIGDIGLSP